MRPSYGSTLCVRGASRRAQRSQLAGSVRPGPSQEECWGRFRLTVIRKPDRPGARGELSSRHSLENAAAEDGGGGDDEERQSA